MRLESMAKSSPFHPTMAVSNIRNNIPVTLQMEDAQYSTWAELFMVKARSHRALHHIIPDGKVKFTVTNEEKDMFVTLDATVLGWIYSTASKDLLNTILEPDITTMKAWEILRGLFQYNEGLRVLSLEQGFTRIHMDDYLTATAYCQRLKEISDQLKNIEAHVSNNRDAKKRVFRGAGFSY